jgi:hypothetical protein
MYVGEMKYLTLKEADRLNEADVDRLPFLKRAAFEDEQEYRIIGDGLDEKERAFPIEIQLRWIAKITLNPWIPKSIAESAIASLQQIEGCQNLDVQRSLLIESGRWKKSGDLVVGNR